MSKRSDKVIAVINATIDAKIAKWEDRIKKYEDYQQTFGGWKYHTQIEELQGDIEVLRMFQQTAVQVQRQQYDIDQLKKKNNELRLLMYRAADKLKGYGEFEVLIRQLKQTADKMI